MTQPRADAAPSCPDGAAALVRFGLGLAALGRPAYHTLGHGAQLEGATAWYALRDRCHAVLDAAWAAGVRHVDVARSYGDGEAFLGAWARAADRGGLRVGSKWGYTYVGGWRRDARVHEVKDHGHATFDRQLPETLARVGPWLATYSIHSATLATGVLDDPEIAGRLGRLAAQGITPGLTVTGPVQADALRHALRTPRRFGVVQATFNLLEPSVLPALVAAKRAGWRVVVKEGVANGRLASAADPRAGSVLAAEARRLGTTPDALALAWVLDHDVVDVVLSGAATVAHLRSNLAASHVQLDARARRVLATLRETPEAYWTHRAGLQWT